MEQPQAQSRERDAPAKADAAAAPVRLPDIAYQMYLGQMQQLATLALALAGGALLMHQVGLFRERIWTGIVAAIVFAVAGLLAVIGTFEITKGVTEGKDIRKTMRNLAVGAMFLLGCGTGAIIMGLLRSAGIR